MEQPLGMGRGGWVAVVVATVTLAVVTPGAVAGVTTDRTAGGHSGSVQTAGTSGGPLQAANDTSYAEETVRNVLTRTIGASEGRVPLVAGQGYDDKVAALEITDSAVRFEEAASGTRILVSVTMHNPNVAPVTTPQFAGELTGEGTVLYRWRADGTPVRNAPPDGRLDSGERRRLTYVLPIDGLEVQRNVVVLGAQNPTPTLSVSYGWRTRYVSDRVTIPGGDGVQCTGDLNVTELTDDVERAVSEIACERPGAPPDLVDGPRPDVEVSPDSLSFADATVGETSTRDVTVENTGNATLRVNRTAVAGDPAFEVSGPSSFELAPGQSRTLTVSFTPQDTASDSATLSVVSNDPDEPDATVYLSSSDIEATVSVEQFDQRTDVDASVENAQAGEPVSITVPDTDDADENATVESVSVTTNTDANFSMNVTASEEPLSTTPEFNVTNRPEDLEFVSVDHSIPNDAIRNASFTYRVNKSALAARGSEPEDFQLYRNVDGEWTAADTTLVTETDDAYLFRANASGFSEWTAAAQVPRINVTDASVNVTAAKTGETVTIDVLLTNTGGSDGLFVTKLLLNGSVVDREEVTVAPDATSLVAFERSFDDPGDYAVQVNDVFVATVAISGADRSVTVTEFADGTADGDADTDSDFGQVSGPIRGPYTIVTLALTAAFLVAGLVMRIRGPARLESGDDAALDDASGGGGTAAESTAEPEDGESATEPTDDESTTEPTDDESTTEPTDDESATEPTDDESDEDVTAPSDEPQEDDSSGDSQQDDGSAEDDSTDES